MENIFLKNHAQNVFKKLVPDSFLKIQNCAYHWINNTKFYTVSFYCMFKLRTTKIYLNQSADHLILCHINLFRERRKSLELISLPLF